MRIYIDDDTASAALANLLRNAAHDVCVPADAGMGGRDDAMHLTYAIQQGRVCLTKNYGDFENLHNLVRAAQGHHPGILVVRQDNDPTRDLTARGIARAIRNLIEAGAAVDDSFFFVINHWR